jgi:hypothetical protein
MNQYQSAIESNQHYLDMGYHYFDNRIDCLYIKRYYQIDDNTFDMISIFNPTQYGINQINERYEIMNLSEKLKAKSASAININESNGNASLKDKLSKSSTTLKGKLIANKSVLDKADLTVNKFAEVESLKDKIETMSIDIVNLQSELKDFAKLALENNAFLATIGKDNKSILNAINSLHGKLASSKIESTIDNGNQKVITRKAIDKPIESIASQNLDNESYQALYEHFKGYFNHKFAKSGKCNKLNEFKFYINGIDFANLNTIDKSARVQWQAFKNDNDNQMIYAPNSMKLAIESLIKLGTDFDLIKNTDMNSSDNIEVKSEVKDFAYWSNLLQVPLSVIQECISALNDNDIKADSTKGLIMDHLKDASLLDKDDSLTMDINSFIEYLSNTNFS